MCLNGLTTFSALLRISSVFREGCGVTIAGSAPATEEAIVTPPASDAKASDIDDTVHDDVDFLGEEIAVEKKAAEECCSCEAICQKERMVMCFSWGLTATIVSTLTTGELHSRCVKQHWRSWSLRIVVRRNKWVRILLMSSSKWLKMWVVCIYVHILRFIMLCLQ